MNALASRAKGQASVRGLRSSARTRSGRPAGRAHRLDLIGMNLATSHRRRHPHRLVVLVLAVCSAALALSALRIDQVRMRYALGEAIAQERQLRQERSQLIVRMRGLRDPSQLQRQASQLGFRRPGQIIDLPAPANPLASPRPPLLADLGASSAPLEGIRP